MLHISLTANFVKRAQTAHGKTKDVGMEGEKVKGMVTHSHIKKFREEHATWVAVRLDKNAVFYALVCFRLFLQVAFHIFTTSPNYQLFRACHDETSAFELCLIYYHVCALAIPTIGSHMNLNRLRSQLAKEVPCMDNFCLKIPTRLRQPTVPVKEKVSNRGVGADNVESL